MQLTIDSKTHAIDGDTVGDVLARAAAQAEATGRLIVEVTVDGSAWDEDALGSPERLAQPADHLEIVTEDRNELVGRTLRDAIAALDEVDRRQQVAAEAIQADRAAEGLPELAEALDLWLHVRHAAVVAAGTLEIDLDALRREDTEADAAFGDLERLLEQLLASIRVQDSAATTDTLLYEMPDVVQRWRSVLEGLARRAESGGEPAA